MAIDPHNFLIRIPKFFLWKSGQDAAGSRFSDISNAQSSTSHAERVLKSMISDEIVGPGKTYDAIQAVLLQIECESHYRNSFNSSGESTSHLFEIDNFNWQFDLLHLRTTIREFCEQRDEINNPNINIGRINNSEVTTI